MALSQPSLASHMIQKRYVENKENTRSFTRQPRNKTDTTHTCLGGWLDILSLTQTSQYRGADAAPLHRSGSEGVLGVGDLYLLMHKLICVMFGVDVGVGVWADIRIGYQHCT